LLKLADGESEMKFIKGVYSNDNDIFIETHFKKANYAIAFEICNYDKIDDDMVLSIFS